MTSAVAAFAVLAGLMTLVPGLDTALVLRAALTQGRPSAFATAAGVCTGVLAWGAGAAVGVAALLTASSLAYTCVRVAGALYMAYLGAVMLRAALTRSARPADAPLDRDPARRRTLARSWKTGFMTNLLNPKIGAFYVAVLPQFIPEDAPHLAAGVLLAAVHATEGMLWFALIIVVASRARVWLARPAATRVVDALTGSALVVFGVKLGVHGR